jgi:hypothetical protein
MFSSNKRLASIVSAGRDAIEPSVAFVVVSPAQPITTPAMINERKRAVGTGRAERGDMAPKF